jgi:hypothetical protein
MKIIDLNCYLLSNIEYILSENLSSVRLREVYLPIGTSHKVSASVKEGCTLNRGYDNSILLKKTNGT